MTCARDRGTLLFVGDEGPGVVEVGRTGQTIGSMTFDWACTASTSNDAEGLTIDEKGVIHLPAEDCGSPASRLFVLTSTAPTSEPGSVAPMLAGLAALGCRVRSCRGY